MKKYFKHLIIILLSVTVSVSCSNDDDDDDIKVYSLIGTWKHLNERMTFKENFEVIFDSLDNTDNILQTDTFIWSTNGDQLTIETPDGFLHWRYTVSATTLKIIYPRGTYNLYTRQ